MKREDASFKEQRLWSHIQLFLIRYTVCDFGDMTRMAPDSLISHTRDMLVGGAQTTLTARASAHAEPSTGAVQRNSLAIAATVRRTARGRGVAAV
jgi:hypothetical protein